MLLNKNVLIFALFCTETLLGHGLFDQVRGDHGKEFYLVLAVQDHLKGFRNNTSRQPYVQTQPKQVSVIITVTKHAV